MDAFSTRKWFRNQYLEEAGLNENVQSKEEAFRVLRDIEANNPKWGIGPDGSGDYYKIKLGQALDFLFPFLACGGPSLKHPFMMSKVVFFWTFWVFLEL